MKKPRADSKLKTLPSAKQDQLWEFLKDHGYEEALAFCKTELGVRTSVGALSDWFSWYPLSKQLQEAASLTNTLKTELLNLPDLDLSDDQLSKAGQVMFEMIAIKQKDSKLYQGLRGLRLRERAQMADERRIVLLEEKAKQADAARETVESSQLTEVQKAARLREIFKK